MDAELDTRMRGTLGWSVRIAPVLPGLDLGQDVVLRRDDAGRAVDLAVVEGVTCLGQSLTLALVTARGTDVFDTDFGFDGLDVIAGSDPPGLARERVRASVIALLGREPRVRRVVDVALDGDRAGPVPGAIAPLAADRRLLDVRVAFEVAGGPPIALDLGPTVPRPEEETDG